MLYYFLFFYINIKTSIEAIYIRIRYKNTACGAVTTVFYTRKLNYGRMTEFLCGKICFYNPE